MELRGRPRSSGRGRAAADLTGSLEHVASSVEIARDERRGRTFVALAAVAWSTAGVLQRGLDVGIADQVAGRAVFAVIGLLVFIGISDRGRFMRAFRVIGRDGLAIAVLMAVSSASFITALNHTTVANVLFMQALAPIIASALAVVMLRERVTRRTVGAMLLALAGVAVMVGAPGGLNAVGGSLSFLMVLSFAVTLVLARRGRDVSMAPAVCMSQALLLLGFGVFAQPGEIGRQDVLLLVLLGFGQMGLGLIFLAAGARLISTADVALISLLEIVLGPLWVWLVWSERPLTGTIVGGAIVVGAVVSQVLSATAATDRTIEYPR
jgi:drug/metabolite transporter (DMT)-like permease